jgi:transposase
MVEFKKILTTSAGELRRVRDTESGRYIYDESLLQIRQINAKIRDCEKRIESLIKQDIPLAINYKLMNSVKGIGLVNAVLILVATANFTLFSDPRKFGCYCGVVPFEHSSGTSVRGKTRVSQMANKKIKTALTQAARNSVRYDPVLREYYLRKLSEGKTASLVLNNVRNKLIHRIFAVVRSGQEYNQTYIHPLKQLVA